MTFENPEYAAMRSLDNRTRADDIESAKQVLLVRHEHAAEQLQRAAINPEDFLDLYSPEGIADDVRYVERMKKIFHEEDRFDIGRSENRKLAEIAEYQILRGLNVQKWLPGCFGKKTSDLDDIKNGVDIVLEYADESTTNRLALAVDVTYSHNLDGKFNRIQSEIDAYDGVENRMSVVKYFHSPNSGFRGELSGLPRVVAALDTEVLRDLVLSSSKEKHISRHIVVAEMLEQLAVYEAYAAAKNPLAQPAIARAHRLLSFINQVLHSQQTLEVSEYIKNRHMDRVMQEQLQRFKV